MQEILHRQLWMKTFLLVVTAALHSASNPYRGTALTLVLKNLTLMLTDSTLELWLFRSYTNDARAFLILL